MADTSATDTANAAGGSMDTPLDTSVRSAQERRVAAEKDQASLPEKADKLAAQQKSEMDKFRKEHVYPHPEVEPWKGKMPENDPVSSFGSIASALGILVSAATKTPLASALNASAAAMTAIRSNDLAKYQEAKDAWKTNTELALKNAEWEAKGYQNALDLMKTNWDEGWAAFKTHATATGNVAVAAMEDVGQAEQYTLGMGRLHAELARLQPELAAAADTAEQRIQLNSYIIDRAKQMHPNFDQLQPDQKRALLGKARLDVEAEQATATRKLGAREESIKARMARTGEAYDQASVAFDEEVSKARTEGRHAAGGAPLSEEKRNGYSSEIEKMEHIKAAVQALGTGYLKMGVKEPLETLIARLPFTEGTTPLRNLKNDLKTLAADQRSKFKSEFSSVQSVLDPTQPPDTILHAIDERIGLLKGTLGGGNAPAKSKDNYSHLWE